MQELLFGIVNGSILALAASGFAMIRQNAGFLNIAHGQFIAIGAYLGLVFHENYGLPIAIAALLVAALTGLVSALSARLVFQPVENRGALVLLFSSVGLAYVLYSLIIMIFGVDVKTYTVDFGSLVTVGSVSLTVGELMMVGTVVAVTIALTLFLVRTTMGRSIRATASNRDLSAIRGIPIRRVSMTVWWIAGALAGLAGMLFGINSSVTPELGWNTILLILAATVMGGLGRIYGVMAAALILGIVTAVSSKWIAVEYAPVVAFGALIIALVLRPEGLFTIKRRAA